MAPGKKLEREFYIRDVLDVAPELIGKMLVISLQNGSIGRFMITEVEAYRGVEDKACHACKGRTARTEIMFHEGGRLYVYFIYGMYWMLNIVTAGENIPHAVLIRSLENIKGPGKITKTIGIDRSFYGEDLTVSDRIWIEDDGTRPAFITSPRIGVNYSGEYWMTRQWRFYI